MKHSLTTGFSFGLTSGIITTLGLLVGLSSGSHSKLVVIGGVLTIAIADAFSDAVGIHVSEESKNKHTSKEIWESTIFTFLFKFLTASTFLVPLLLFHLNMAVIISIIWGLSCLSIFSFLMARNQNVSPWKVVLEHLVIAIIVVLATHHVGKWIACTFST